MIALRTVALSLTHIQPTRFAILVNRASIRALQLVSLACGPYDGL
jgi:hypothetical protein